MRPQSGTRPSTRPCATLTPWQRTPRLRRAVGPSAAGGRAGGRVGCSGWVYRDWRGPVYPAELPQRRWFASYAEALRHGRAERDVLPSADHDRGRALGGAGTRRIRVRGEAGAVRLASHEARDAASWLPNHLDRVERLGARWDRRSCSCRPAGGATSRASTSSSAPRRTRCARRSRCVTIVVARRCVRDARPSRRGALHARPARASRGCAPPTGRTCASRPDAMTQKYVGRYGGRRLWRRPNGSRSGWTRASTRTRTSTTTTTAPRSPTRRGSGTACGLAAPPRVEGVGARARSGRGGARDLGDDVGEPPRWDLTAASPSMAMVLLVWRCCRPRASTRAVPVGGDLYLPARTGGEGCALKDFAGKTWSSTNRPRADGVAGNWLPLSHHSASMSLKSARDLIIHAGQVLRRRTRRNTSSGVVLTTTPVAGHWSSVTLGAHARVARARCEKSGPRRPAASEGLGQRSERLDPCPLEHGEAPAARRRTAPHVGAGRDAVLVDRPHHCDLLRLRDPRPGRHLMYNLASAPARSREVAEQVAVRRRVCTW